MQPRPNADTSRPLLPNFLYFIVLPFNFLKYRDFNLKVEVTGLIQIPDAKVGGISG
jgi:hypothetical protein